MGDNFLVPKSGHRRDKQPVLGLADPNIFLQIAASVVAAAAAAAVHHKGMKTLLDNSISTLPIKRKAVFSNGSRGLLKNPPDFPILCNWVFDKCILADKPFAKALRSLKTCVLANNKLCRKLMIKITNNIWWKFQSYFSTVFYSWI